MDTTNYDEQNIGRVVPHDIGAESCVLGCMIQDPVAIDEVSHKIKAEDFHRPAHQIIFTVLLEMCVACKPIDLVLLRDELGEARLSSIGGIDYLVALIEGVPGISNVGYYADIVIEKAKRRSLITAGREMITAAYESMDDAAELVSKAQDGLFSLVTDDGSEMSGSGRDGAIAAIETVIARKNGTDVSIFPTPYHAVNESLGGFEKGYYVSIGGVTGTGKTCLALDIVAHAAEQGKSFVYFSCEMSAEKLSSRMLHKGAKISGRSSRLGLSTDSDIDLLKREAERTKGWKAEYVFGKTTEIELHQKCNALRRKWGHLDYIVVDYITEMGLDHKLRDTRAKVESYSSAINTIAKTSGAIALVVSQFSRSVVKENRKPTMGDLKESGKLENDSDVVLLLHDMGMKKVPCANYSHRGENGTRDPALFKYIALLVGKGRDGSVTNWPPEGAVSSTKYTTVLKFYGQMTLFEETYRSGAPAVVQQELYIPE